MTVAKMSGGAAVVEALRLEGVRHVFGIIGTAMLEVFDALYERPDVRYVGVRHEQNAMHMADGYARMLGRPSVVLAGQPGPGATNLVTGLAEARLAFSPVVALCGHTASTQVDRGTFQEVDQQALFTPVTKRTLTVHSAARLPEYVQEAFRISESGRRGPVALNIPGDLLAGEIDAEFRAPQTLRADTAIEPSVDSIRRAVEILSRAERPLIIVGAGAKWAQASGEVVALAERLNAPVAASAGNGDAVPNDHPLFVGQVGRRGNEVATDLARTADVILALGTRLGYNTTLFSHEIVGVQAQIIQVDIEPTAVGRHFPVAVGIAADARAVSVALLAQFDQAPARTEWVDTAQARRAQLLTERDEAGTDTAAPFKPLAAFAAIQRVLPRNAVVTIDTGTCALHATDVVQTFQPPALLTPLDFGLVGFSYAAGLGAKAAAPERPVLSLIGDGGFGMAMCELGTAIEAGLSTVTVVLNNGCWGAEKAYQRDFFQERYIGADIVNPAFDAVARAYGARGIRVETADDLAAAVADGFRDDVPTLVEVPIDPASITSFRRDAFPHRDRGGQAEPGAASA